MYLCLKGLNAVEIRNDLVATFKGAAKSDSTVTYYRPFGKESRNASFSLLKNIMNIDFFESFSEMALLEHHRVIMPTSMIPHKTNNANSRPRW
jgi:hypothetical protein